MVFGSQKEKNEVKKEVDSFFKKLNSLQKSLHKEMEKKSGLKERILKLEEED